MTLNVLKNIATGLSRKYFLADQLRVYAMIPFNIKYIGILKVYVMYIRYIKMISSVWLLLG